MCVYVRLLLIMLLCECVYVRLLLIMLLCECVYVRMLLIMLLCECISVCARVYVCVSMYVCMYICVCMYVSAVFPDAFEISFQQGTLKLFYFHLQNIFGTLYLIFQLFLFYFSYFQNLMIQRHL